MGSTMGRESTRGRYARRPMDSVSSHRRDGHDSSSCLLVGKNLLCSKKFLYLVVIATLSSYIFISMVWPTSLPTAASIRDSRLGSMLFESLTSPNQLHSNATATANDSLPSKESVERDFEIRRRMYENACVPNKVGRVFELFIHPPSKLAVCHVQKTGCTFWKRLFRYLYQDYDKKPAKDVKSPFDVDRILVHFGSSTTYRTYRYRTPQEKALADSMTKVMFARDPYNRLWSSYVDKFILPDSWLDHGRSMLFSRRPVNRNAKRGSVACSSDIQFEEFLGYTLRNYDDHWKPITDICDPCTFHPKYVGHMETFGRDVKYILDTMGLAHLMEKNHDHTTHVLDEMKILIDYHFRLYQDRRPLQSCLSQVELASRLWKVFQINGYIKMDATFVEDRVRQATNHNGPLQSKDQVIQIFHEEFLANPISKKEWQAQREANIVNAYRSIPKSLKDKIAKRFHNDFKMFGFDPRPPDERLS